jgi:hypothetical protein
MKTMLETKATNPSVVNVKKGTASINRLFNGTLLMMILAATYSQIRKELEPSVKNNAFTLLTAKPPANFLNL